LSNRSEASESICRSVLSASRAQDVEHLALEVEQTRVPFGEGAPEARDVLAEVSHPGQDGLAQGVQLDPGSAFRLLRFRVEAGEDRALLPLDPLHRAREGFAPRIGTETALHPARRRGEGRRRVQPFLQTGEPGRQGGGEFPEIRIAIGRGGPRAAEPLRPAPCGQRRGPQPHRRGDSKRGRARAPTPARTTVPGPEFHYRLDRRGGQSGHGRRPAP
jgi:hypothetical protein